MTKCMTDNFFGILIFGEKNVPFLHLCSIVLIIGHFCVCDFFLLFLNLNFTVHESPRLSLSEPAHDSLWDSVKTQRF